MAYSINPNLPKARAVAMRLLVSERLPALVVANKCGVHRSTIWRWKLKWEKLNENVQFDNPNRPNRRIGIKNKLTSCSWRIDTCSSKPMTSPMALSSVIVERIVELRRTLRRCAEVVWHHLKTIDGISVSLSSVRRVLVRSGHIRGRRKRVRYDNPIRPLVTRPGELVQTDTIHYVCPLTKKRRYVYTVIDLYTRMAYAKASYRILPGVAARTILEAQEAFGFHFLMVQSDNGSEFSRYFEQVLRSNSIQTRHSRLGRPNDNAHIERFNRTIQEECLGSSISYRPTNQLIQAKITKYLGHYNNTRVHLGIQMRTPSQMLQRS